MGHVIINLIQSALFYSLVAIGVGVGAMSRAIDRWAGRVVGLPLVFLLALAVLARAWWQMWHPSGPIFGDAEIHSFAAHLFIAAIALPAVLIGYAGLAIVQRRLFNRKGSVNLS